MIFTVRTDRWADKVIVPACDEALNPEEVTYMSRREGRCILERGHMETGRRSHLCDTRTGSRSSWWEMTDEEYEELQRELKGEG